MTVTALKKQFQTRTLLDVLTYIRDLTWPSLIAAAASLLFVMYFAVPHVGVLWYVFHYNVIYIVGLPIVAFIASICAIKEFNGSFRSSNSGLGLSYVILALTSLYFLIAAAVGAVLAVTYAFYAFIL